MWGRPRLGFFIDVVVVFPKKRNQIYIYNMKEEILECIESYRNRTRGRRRNWILCRKPNADKRYTFQRGLFTFSLISQPYLSFILKTYMRSIDPRKDSSKDFSMDRLQVCVLKCEDLPARLWGFPLYRLIQDRGSVSTKTYKDLLHPSTLTKLSRVKNLSVLSEHWKPIS